jgi:hypothetical protein
MGDQPVSLLIGEGIVAAIAVLLGVVVVASWLMGQSNRARGFREAPPLLGEVPSRSHVPGSMSR